MKTLPNGGVPEGLWKRCPGCQATIFRKEAEQRLSVCPECNYHLYVSAPERIRQLLDEDTFEEWYADLDADRPAGLRRPDALPRAAQGRAGAHRPERGGRGRRRHDSRAGAWPSASPIRRSSWAAWARSSARS